MLSRGTLGCGTSQDCVEIETLQPGLRGRVSSRCHGGDLCTPLRLPLTPALGAQESGISKCCADPCTSSADGHACSLWKAGTLIAYSLSLQVTPGVDGQKASPQEIGAATYKALTRVVPPAVPGQPLTRQQSSTCMFEGSQLLHQPRSALPCCIARSRFSGKAFPGSRPI